jgi:hypothetical protein
MQIDRPASTGFDKTDSGCRNRLSLDRHQGLKPIPFRHGEARLKPCPDTRPITPLCFPKCRNSSGRSPDRPFLLSLKPRTRLVAARPGGPAQTWRSAPPGQNTTGTPREACRAWAPLLRQSGWASRRVFPAAQSLWPRRAWARRESCRCPGSGCGGNRRPACCPGA